MSSLSFESAVSEEADALPGGTLIIGPQLLSVLSTARTARTARIHAHAHAIGWS